MIPLKPKKSWQDELWNVSLFPSTDSPTPPGRPEPPAAGALTTAPLLSICETVAEQSWRQAA